VAHRQTRPRVIRSLIMSHSQAKCGGGASQHMIFSPDIQYQTSAHIFQPLAHHHATMCTPKTKRREPSSPSRAAAQQAQFQQAPFPWIGAAAQRRREPFPFDFVPLQWREFPLQRQRWQPANLRFTPDGCMQRPGHYCSSCSCYQFSVWPRPDNQPWTHALPSLETDTISGHQIPWSVMQCGSACTILHARFLRA
jgi:hypothetical protein